MLQGLIIVEICEANEAMKLQVRQLLSANSAVTIMEADCMSQCTLCAQQPYAYINGKQITAPSLTEFLKALEAQVSATFSDYSSET